MEEEYEIAPALHALAERWSWYWDSSAHMYIVDTMRGVEQRVQIEPVKRCCACHEEIYGFSGVLPHLLLSHGYRMDGRQFDNRNELIGHA